MVVRARCLDSVIMVLLGVAPGPAASIHGMREPEDAKRVVITVRVLYGRKSYRLGSIPPVCCVSSCQLTLLSLAFSMGKSLTASRVIVVGICVLHRSTVASDGVVPCDIRGLSESSVGTGEVFALHEERQELLPAEPGVADGFPFVVVVGLAPHKDHGIYG